MQNALAELREQLNLTQQDIADVLGVRRDVVAKIEGSHRRLTLAEWLLLVEKLPISLETALALAQSLVGKPQPGTDPDDDEGEPGRSLAAA